MNERIVDKSQPAVGVLVTVRARPEGFWENTGITMSKDARYEIRYVEGHWRCNPHWGPTDAAGSSEHTGTDIYLLPGAPQGSLVAKIGGTNGGWGERTAFPVGMSGFAPKGAAGLLWLGVNDHPGGFGDNSGAITVRVIAHLRHVDDPSEVGA